MRQSTGALNITTTDSPTLRRSGRNSASPNPPRKSERLSKNQNEGSSSRKKSEKLSRPVLNSCDELAKGSSMINVKRRKVSVQTSGVEKEDAKRRLDARCFRTLFVEQRKRRLPPILALASIKKPTQLENPHQSACRSTDNQEAKDRDQTIDNQSDNKRDPDSSNRVAAEVQFEGVVATGGCEKNDDCEVHASKCKASPAKSDFLKGRSSEDFECVSCAPHVEDPPECDGNAYVPNNTLASSQDKEGSASHVESDEKQEEAISRDSSLHVDVIINEENVQFKDAYDSDQCNAEMDSAQILDSDSAYVSRSGNGADNLSGKSALSPKKYRFAEYWVPARLSNLQLEQYCFALLSNSMTLRSSSRSDPVGALRNLLVTLRQTCSHPFLVDPTLSSSLLKDVKETDYLEVGIKASGKLQLLDSMLLQMRKQGLRVLILYESIDGRDGIGDILDDFLRQRYGTDSYERVDGGGFVPSKKQAALNKFNDKESGRFAFLLEAHACLPSIKLSSVDAIIIHNSEWNPFNDIRALQKIVIDSQHDPIKVFRLFLPKTVEENAMVLAQHNVAIDNSMHNISQINRDKLLMNGASDLFDELERFHLGSAPVSTVISSMESSLLQDVVEELMTILLQKERQMVDGLSVCLKMQHNDGDHGKYYLVSDELNTLLEEKWPSGFWSKLLEGRNPQWKNVSSVNQRNRKRVRYNESNDSQPSKSDDAVKKRKKVVHDSTEITPTVENEKVVVSDKDSGCDGHLSESLQLSGKSITVEDVRGPLDVQSNNAVKSGNMLGKGKKVNDTPKNLFLKLKPELRKLCEVLNLPEDVKYIAERLLEFAMDYLTDNQDVSREPITTLQAFQLSLCWVAASLRKYNINCQESLALAKQRLKYYCNEDDADYMYLKMGLFKELFIHQIGTDKANDLVHDKAARVFDPEKLMVKMIKQIKKKCRQRLEILMQKHLKELEQLKMSIDEEWAQLEQSHEQETNVVHSIHADNSPEVVHKSGIVEDQLSMKQERQNKKNNRLKSLEDKHVSEMEKEDALTSNWKENIVKEQLEILRKLRLCSSDNREQKCSINGQLMVSDCHKNGSLLGVQEISNGQFDVLARRGEVGQLEISEGPHTLRAVASEAINKSVGVDSEILASAEVLIDHSTSFLAGGAQLPRGQVNQSPDIEMLEPSSGDAYPVNSQLLSPSNGLISGSGLSNTPIIDGSQSHSRDCSVGNLHESQAPSTRPNDPLPLSPCLPDNEADNSSPNGCPLLQVVNSSSRQIDSEVSDTGVGHAELHVILSNEQSLTESDIGPSAAELVYQLPHSSSSQQNSGQPMLQLQARQGVDSNCNAGAQNLVTDNNIEHPNPSQLPAAAGVSCIPSTTVAATPASLPVPRDTHDTPGFSNSLLPDATVTSTVSTRVPFVYMDPLQGELERIQKEADRSIKIYEDLKQQFNSECEKEIEEMISQIRKKYEAKIVELDAAFMRKKRELESYHKKVFMNKMLAEAFRNKCIELKGSAPPGMSQDKMQRQMPRPLQVSGQQMAPVASSAIQTSGNFQPTHISIQPRNQQATHGHNPSRLGGHTGAATQIPPRPAGPSRFAAVQTSGNPQTTHNQNQMRVGVSTVAPLPRHTAPTSSGPPLTRQYLALPSRNSIGTSSPVEAVISLPAQTVGSSSVLFSSNLSRPDAVPPIVNLHSTTGIRASPPHIQARVSQPTAPNATFTSSLLNSQIQYSNVPLAAPLAPNPNGFGSNQQMVSELKNQANCSMSSAVVCLSDDD